MVVTVVLRRRLVDNNLDSIAQNMEVTCITCHKAPILLGASLNFLQQMT